MHLATNENWAPHKYIWILNVALNVYIPVSRFIGYTVIQFINIYAQTALPMTFLTTAFVGEGSTTILLPLLSSVDCACNSTNNIHGRKTTNKHIKKEKMETKFFQLLDSKWNK